MEKLTWFIRLKFHCLPILSLSHSAYEVKHRILMYVAVDVLYGVEKSVAYVLQVYQLSINNAFVFEWYH
jgi:hypothetical protein